MQLPFATYGFKPLWITPLTLVEEENILHSVITRMRSSAHNLSKRNCYTTSWEAAFTLFFFSFMFIFPRGEAVGAMAR
jgi:hypothetical protein